MKQLCRLTVALSVGLTAPVAFAEDVRITTFKDQSSFSLNGQTFTITRNQDTSARLSGDFTLTSRECPPNCIQPMSVADGVATLGELEVLAFLEGEATNGEGLLIDARVPADFGQSTIPGAVNVPYLTLEETNRFRSDILRALGAVPTADGALDFSNAMALTIFCNGPWSSNAPDAVENLLRAGYPPEKLRYYRGGMQGWLQLGLDAAFPRNEG